MINSISGKLAYAIMLAVFREKIVGVMTLEGKESATNLGLVAISEEMQGKSVGKNLMNATFRYIADEKKHDIVTTVTHGQDERACRFYEKMGFELMDEIRVYHFWPHGSRV